MQNKKVILTDDLPSGLRDLMRMFWEPEEARDEELDLPEAKRVEAFLQWYLQDLDWEKLNRQEEEYVQWLMEHGYHPIKQGNTEFTEGQQSKQDNSSGHKLVTEERYAELKKRMLELLNEQTNK